MDTTKLIAIVSIILALSVASERLVEIIKGLFPWLSGKSADPTYEGFRCAAVQVISVLCAVGTAYLASDYIPAEIGMPSKTWSVWGLGLLASGGSGFWNSVLTYLTKVKDLKADEADAKTEAKAKLRAKAKAKTTG